MPMLQNFTSISQQKKRVRRTSAQPSKLTLDILRNFARTYSPNDACLSEKAKLILS